MTDDPEASSFRLAPMSASIRMLTSLLLVLPLALLIASIFTAGLLAVPAVFVAALYAWIWLWLRPSRFVVHRDRIGVHWPLARREILREDITNVRMMDGRQLKQEIGWGVRVGAGGIWGAFGWLWTTRRGFVHLYVSRAGGYVWIERTGDRPWLITPEQPEAFVRALSP